VSGDPAAVPAVEALRMATLGGARALGLGDRIGSIEVGKWADLACLDLERLHSHPVYDPVSQLVYTASASQVSDVWVAGRHQVEEGKLAHASEDEIFARSAEWQLRIAGTTGKSAAPGR
ncbi:MAG: amidohydrolase family protein, partial [Gammaproteobacteria bacterium]|nr:amidohydrolase family protein [Gammaproteobacteria bacterium]